MSEKLEFASAEWVGAMRAIVEGKLGKGKVDLTTAIPALATLHDDIARLTARSCGCVH